jgi:hypothetical protein
MAMMTVAEMRRPGGCMVARNCWACKRRRPKSECALKSGHCLKSAVCYERGGDLSALAARISTTIEWTAGDIAMCLARQAGPGPRI